MPELVTEVDADCGIGRAAATVGQRQQCGGVEDHLNP
jgi:hypothetical protein